VDFGFYQATLDVTQASTFTTGFIDNFGGGTVAGASAALLSGLNAGAACFNVHSTTYAGGEIRGLLQPVPEPGTWALMGLGLAAMGGLARRRAAARPAYPRPTKGMPVAITVMNSTLASSGRLAM
jgi:hypothetical protein